MKTKVFKYLIWLSFLIMIVGNIFVFVSGIQISDEINRLEKQIVKLHEENIDLEKEINQATSFQHTASIAAELNFTSKLTPLLIVDQKYARK